MKKRVLKINPRSRGLARKRELAQRKKRFAEIFLKLREEGKGDSYALKQAALAVGYSQGSAQSMGSRMLNDPMVQQMLSGAVAKHMERAEVNGETIMRYWHDLATTEIPFPPAGPCRHCWGDEHQYQYTLSEFRNAQRKHTSEQLKKSPHLRVPFDELGGIGFDKTKKPHPYCTECNGLGRNYMMVIDRDKLTAGQRMAIDEIKVSPDGSVSLKMRDRSRAMENLQALMGMIQPRKPLEVIDPNRPIEENVNILLQTAIDQGLLTMPSSPPPQPSPVLENDGDTEQLADADAA